jgi:zinc transport system substrate-binding protein
MKKICSKLILVFLTVSLVFVNTSCVYYKKSEKEKISIVCTAFPQYDFVKEIIKGNENKFDVLYLFDNGADVHSFETDIGFKVKAKIIESDIFIYNGGESDSWVNTILSDESMNSKCICFSLLDCISKDLLIPLNNSHQHHEHGSMCDDSSCMSTDYENIDEHVWLSLTNAEEICKKIAEKISMVDSENKEIYEANLKSYSEKLLTLHNESSKFFSGQTNPHLIVADRFPFVYLFKEYNISYDSAFSGCTSETDATYENIIKLCKSVEKNNIDSLIVLEKSNSNISSSIISSVNKDLQIYTINSLQSVSRAEIINGFNYYDTMKNNIDSLKKALKK